MGDIVDHILQRRSIRKFTDAPVPRERIDALLQAAMAAPSASNRRPWEFIVVTEPTQLRQLRTHLVFGRYEAPLAIVVCGNMRRALPPPGREFWIEDCSGAIQNILLAATGLGLGSVWIGVHPVTFFSRGVAKILSLPRHVRPLGLIHIGWPAETKAPRTQYDASRVHWQRWRSKEAPN